MITYIGLCNGTKLVDSTGHISVQCRHHVKLLYMLQKFSVILLSSAQKITYYAFENCPLFLKLCHHNWLIMPVYCCIRPFSLMFMLQIVLNSLAGCCIRVFHFNVTALLETIIFSDCSIRVSRFLNQAHAHSRQKAGCGRAPGLL